MADGEPQDPMNDDLADANEPAGVQGLSDEELVFKDGADPKLPGVMRIDFKMLERKPWEEEGANLSDFFNFGIFSF